MMNQIKLQSLIPIKIFFTDDIIDSLNEKPKLLERKPIAKSH